MITIQKLTIDPLPGETPTDVAIRIGYYNYARLERRQRPKPVTEKPPEHFYTNIIDGRK